jgi:hypothetical protein
VFVEINSSLSILNPFRIKSSFIFLDSPFCRAEGLCQQTAIKLQMVVVEATPRNLRGFVDLTEVNPIAS